MVHLKSIILLDKYIYKIKKRKLLILSSKNLDERAIVFTNIKEKKLDVLKINEFLEHSRELNSHGSPLTPDLGEPGI